MSTFFSLPHRGHQAIRRLFLNNGLWCVVNLPAQVFQPYSGVKTSILFLDKTLKPDQILFYEIENHGFTLNTNPSPIDKNDLPNALENIKEYREDLRNGKTKKINKTNRYSINKKSIEENAESSLSGRLYRGSDVHVEISTWENIEIGNLAKVFADGDWIERKNQSSNGIRLIQTGNIGLGEYKDKENKKSRYISEQTFKRLGCTEIFPCDILISRLPDPIGRACIIPKLKTRMITAVDCTIIRLDEVRILPKYFLFVSKSKNYFDEISKYLTGASRQRISRSNLAKVRIPLPPIKIQKQIVDEIENYQQMIDDDRKNIETLQQKIEAKIKSIYG